MLIEEFVEEHKRIKERNAIRLKQKITYPALEQNDGGSSITFTTFSRTDSVGTCARITVQMGTLRTPALGGKFKHLVLTSR